MHFSSYIVAEKVFLMKATAVSLLFFFFFLLVGCKSTESSMANKKQILKNNYLKGNSIALYEGINDTSFVKLKNLSGDFVFDMKYATADNFLKQKVYDCDECYLRMKTIKNLMDDLVLRVLCRLMYRVLHR